MSKRTTILSLLVTLALVAGVLGYVYRTSIRETIYTWQQPEVPTAVSFKDMSGGIRTEQSVMQEGKTDQAITEKKTVATSSSAEQDPVATAPAALPSEIQLDVPFLLQAPKQNWVDPFEDACEEASLLMVNAYYAGKGSDFGEEEGTQAILDLVAYEDATYGHDKDTNTEEVAATGKNNFGYQKTVVKDIQSARDIKEILAKGYPVIVPAYGKALKNPNFKNGGPEYHMLVIKGYTKDGYWITNDPGTRKGKGYVYPEEVLMHALHEFNATDMTKGAKRMIVLIP